MAKFNFSRKPTNLVDLPNIGTDNLLLLSDQQQDNMKLSGVNVSTSSFVRLGMKNANINDCSFTQSTFKEIYFRKTTFKNVRFTGSSFKFCNFDKASFQSCDFRYCTFYHCRLPKDEIKACLPSEANLKRDLSRNLRANFEMIGDKRAADDFLDIEIQANEAELKAIILSSTEYYKKHYRPLDQINAFMTFVSSKLSGMIWGYGHRVTRLFISYVTITCLLSFIPFISNISFAIKDENLQRPLNFWESLYMGFGQTVSLSGLPFEPVNLLGKVLMLSASFLGAIFLALLAATLYRRIAR